GLRLPEDAVLGPPRLVRHLVAVLGVAAGAGRAVAGAGEDGRADEGVVMEPVEAGEEVRAHRRIHRIHLLGAVERDGHHKAIGRALDEQVTIRRRHWSGVREAGNLRGWPEQGAAWPRPPSAVNGGLVARDAPGRRRGATRA